MSVLKRHMFNRGGFAHRGTGITSGLVPAFKHAGEVDIEEIKKQQKEYYELIKDVKGEEDRPSKFELLGPAAMQFFGSLMSGKSYQGGFGGAMDILGQSLVSTTPALQDAMKESRAYEQESESELKTKALEMALDQIKPGEYETRSKSIDMDGDGVADSTVEEESWDGHTWSIIPGSAPKKIDKPNFITGSNDPKTTYSSPDYEDGKEFHGHQEYVDGNLVTKNSKGVVIPNATKHVEEDTDYVFRKGVNVSGGMLEDQESTDGGETFTIVGSQYPDATKIVTGSNTQYTSGEDPTLIDGYQILEGKKLVTYRSDNGEVIKNAQKAQELPELGESVWTVVDLKTHQPTGEQLDLAVPADRVRYDEILALEGFVAVKTGVQLQSLDDLTSQTTKKYSTDNIVSMDSNILFVDELWSTYQITFDPNFVPVDSVVGWSFNFLNNVRGNIENLAGAFVSGDSQDHVFEDDSGNPLKISAEEFLIRVAQDKGTADRLREIAGAGNEFYSRIVGLAYELAKSQNPDGRISEPDFRYALKQMQGITTDKSIMGNVILLNYERAKNRFVQSWINNHLQSDGELVFEVDGTQTTARAEAEREWFARSEFAQHFETQVAEQDVKNDTNNAEISATRQNEYLLPKMFHDINLYDIENDKLAQETIKEWLDSPAGPDPAGGTWFDFITTNNFILTYIDKDGKKQYLKITRTEED